LPGWPLASLASADHGRGVSALYCDRAKQDRQPRASQPKYCYQPAVIAWSPAIV